MEYVDLIVLPTVKEGSGYAALVGRPQDAAKFQKATTHSALCVCLCFAAVFTAVEPRNGRLPCKRTWPDSDRNTLRKVSHGRRKYRNEESITCGHYAGTLSTTKG
jgi:hypothetical protein